MKYHFINFRSSLLLFLSLAFKISTAQNNFPVLPNTGTTSASFIPTGWKLIHTASGDLNKDSIADIAMIIENTDQRNMMSNNGGLGADTLNLNPRLLLIILKDPNTNSYHLVARNSEFIPKPNDADNSCLSDPIGDSGVLSIKKGVLNMASQYWYSCGSWYSSNCTFVFRFQNARFELIGFDERSYHRASGEMSETSINFSTKKKIVTSGENMFDDKKSKPKKKSYTLKPFKPYVLENLLATDLDKIMSL